MVWVRIYFAFTSPRFEFIVDPWLYFVGRGISLFDVQQAGISLVDNEAEESSLKQTRRRVDDLALNVNKLGPSLTMLNRRCGYSFTSEAMDEFKDAEGKDPVSR